MKKFSSLQEDLRQWFDPKHPKGGWKRINSKGEAIGPCAREPGEAKPKCMSNEKRAKLSKKERASAVAAKRKHDPNPERQGKPINVSNFGKGKISEDMEKLDEKNVPTSPEKWAQAKAQAKAKFDVYPSAYANGWAAKKYKAMGGGWKSVSEAKDPGEYDQEGDMAKTQLRSIIYHAQELHDQLEKNTNLPEWVQSKITLAQDYVQTACDYMYSQKNESVSEAKEVGDDPINDGTPSLLKKKGNKMVNCSEEFAGWVAHYNGQKHEIQKHQAKDLYDAKKKAIEHFKVPKHKQGLLSVKPGYNESIEEGTDVKYISTEKLKKHWDTHKDQTHASPVFAAHLKRVGQELAKRKALNKEQVEQIDEITQKLAGNYVAKVTQQNLQKHGMQHDMFGKLSKNRQQGVSNAFKRLEVDKEGKPVHHLVTREEKEQVEESRGHKVLATFFKNRQAAQNQSQDTTKTDHDKWKQAYNDARTKGSSSANARARANGAVYEQHANEGRFKPTVPHNVRPTAGVTPREKFTQKVVREDTLDEGKMGELHADLSDHLDKHIANYKKVGGAEHFGHKTTQVASKIAKLHGIQQHHAQKFVNDYVENKLKEEKENVPFDPPYKKVKGTGTVTDKSGAKHTPMSRARDLARLALKRQQEKKVNEQSNIQPNPFTIKSEDPGKAPSRKAQIVRDALKKGKKSDDKFQSEPVLANSVDKSAT